MIFWCKSWFKIFFALYFCIDSVSFSPLNPNVDEQKKRNNSKNDDIERLKMKM